MSDSNSRGPNEGNQKPGHSNEPGNASFNWRGLILLGLAVLLIGSALVMRGEEQNVKAMSFAEFLEELHGGKIDLNKPIEAVITEGRQEEYIKGFRMPDVTTEGMIQKDRFKVSVALRYEYERLQRELSEAKAARSGREGVDAEAMPSFALTYTYDRNAWSGAIHFIPILLFLLILFFIFRQQMRMAGRNAMSFGKSRAKLLSLDRNRVTFKDVAGVEEAKEEVWEIVDFLRDPKKFQRLGGSIPKGVLMVGSPGTGKTLLAKAIAGEADVPFFSISGSDFVEMFVGVGASRVRDMFEQGKKNAPCLIFIDEIDAVGRHRGHGMGGGHDEREQTLNQLLVEMDGFDTQDGVIIIAATNRPDVLDPALLRPGRFDRQVTVSLPDVKGREQILKVHSKKVKMGAEVDLNRIARGTPGFSGAELANLINEAALLAARKGLQAISNAELEEARDKVRWGRERRSLALSEHEKEVTAYHEGGHAILLALLKNTDALHKVTIIPRGPYLGAAFHLPKEDKYQTRRTEVEEQLIVAMGGRVAEELIFGEVTSGASGDIRMATRIAKSMVCEWGMSKELGMVEYGDTESPVFVARDMGRSRPYSEATAQKIDSEIKRIIDHAYNEATRILGENRDKLEIIAKALLEFETLEGSHIIDIIEHGEMRDPPSIASPPDIPEGDEEGKKDGERNRSKSEGDLPPDLASAPA